MKTHLEVLHETDGWRTACGAHAQRTSSRHDNVDCLQCRSTYVFRESGPESGPALCLEAHDGKGRVRPHSIKGYWQVWSGGICIALLRPKDVAPILASPQPGEVQRDIVRDSVKDTRR